MPAQRRLTVEDRARAAAMDAPSRKVTARVFGEYLSQDVLPIEPPFTFNGWRVARYPSHITPGFVYVCADRLLPDGRPEVASEDCADDAAARAWIKGLGA